MFRNCQLKFCLFGDPLFNEEESRWLQTERRNEFKSIVGGESNLNSEYLLDLDFTNISHLTYTVTNYDESRNIHLPAGKEVFVTLLIQMNKPSNCRKKNFLTAYGKQRLSAKKRMNEWFECNKPSACRSPLNMGEEEANLFLNFWNVSQTYFLKGRTTIARFDRFKEILRSRCINAIIVEETTSIGVQILDQQMTRNEMKALKVRGYQFKQRLDQFRL